MVSEEAHAVGGADRSQDPRVIEDVDQPAQRHDDEPQAGDRSEERRNFRGAEALNGEETDQDHEADG